MLYKHSLLGLAAVSFLPVNAIELDSSSFASIRSAASGIAKGLVDYYDGNEPGQTPGVLDPPYFWWNAGLLFDVLIQYHNLTGDSQYNNIVAQALEFQQGENKDYMSVNETQILGNDDQSTWALAALSAAEGRFPAGGAPYLQIAQTVFNQQVARWDNATCNGGLRWQIFSFNLGYTYKNAISNGNFFQLAARLALDTGNKTYQDWAVEAFKWPREVGLIDNDWNVLDGAQVPDGCQTKDRTQWSANAGTYIVGAANMYNVTGASTAWKDILDKLLDRTLELFFPNGIATEVACESADKCNPDQENFKGQLAHQLVDTIRVAPYTANKIRPFLKSSAEAAAKACDASGDNCRLSWNAGSTQDRFSLGTQLSALSFVQSLLLWDGSTPAAGSGNATTTNSTQPGSQSSPTPSRSSTPLPGNSAAAFGPGSALMAVTVGLVMLAAL